MLDRDAVGLDLSLTGAGVVVVSADGSMVATTVGEKGRKAPAGQHDYVAKLERFYRNLDGIEDALLGIYDPLIALEGPSYASGGSSTHDIAGNWWITYEAIQKRWPSEIVIVAPSTLKQYVAQKGNASKDEMLIQTVRRYPDFPVSNNNEADALGLAAMARRQLGAPLEQEMTQVMDKAMKAVRWPG